MLFVYQEHEERKGFLITMESLWLFVVAWLFFSEQEKNTILRHH